MKKKLDSLSKEGVVIGALTLVFSLLLITVETEEWMKSLQSQEIRTEFINENKFHKLIVYGAAALISILLILGIITRRAMLMTPLLLTAFVGATFSFYFFLQILIFIPFGGLHYMVYVIPVIGMECVALYPLCALFVEIRRERQAQNKIRNYSKM